MSTNSPGVKHKQHERDQLQSDVDKWLADGNTIKQLAPGETTPLTEADMRKRRAKIHNASIKRGS